MKPFQGKLENLVGDGNIYLFIYAKISGIGVLKGRTVKTDISKV